MVPTTIEQPYIHVCMMNYTSRTIMSLFFFFKLCHHVINIRDIKKSKHNFTVRARGTSECWVCPCGALGGVYSYTNHKLSYLASCFRHRVQIFPLWVITRRPEKQKNRRRTERSMEMLNYSKAVNSWQLTLRQKAKDTQALFQGDFKEKKAKLSF